LENSFVFKLFEYQGIIETVKITSPIASEAGIIVAMQHNHLRLMYIVIGSWSVALVRMTSISIK